jgi:hypothetical protein
MPLPNVSADPSLQCRARSKRSQERCKNPAAYGMATCRMHGARRPETVKRGPGHPGWRRGEETLQAKADRAAKLTELRHLEAIMHAAGILAGPRWRGRKPAS